MAEKSKTVNLDPRIGFFKFDLQGEKLEAVFTESFNQHNGDWPAIKSALKGKKGFTDKIINKLEFTHHLASWSKENAKVILLFQQDDNIQSLRDIALTLDKAAFVDKVKSAAPGQTDEEQLNFALSLRRDLFKLESSAMLVNMIKAPDVPFLNDVAGNHIAAVLSKQPEFNIKTTSVYELIKNKEAFRDIADDAQDDVIGQLKSLQRITAISPEPDAVPVLYNAKVQSAMQVASLPKAQFMAAFKDSDLGEMALAEIHHIAQQVQVRNEQFMIAVREAAQPTHVAMIDKSKNQLAPSHATTPPPNNAKLAGKDWEKYVKDTVEQHNLSWDLLFGDTDFCECGECNSVYSPAAYFVELLNYLRNNNLDPHATGAVAIKPDPKDISGTPLAKLLERRPDLGCLELTCQNAFTLIPYVDLVNEVMENYVAFKKLKPFNVHEETSDELLAQPRNTEYQAYSILKDEVYPFTLPYHQPIDATRIYLKFLDSSRYELTKTFRTNNASDDAELTQLQDLALDRAIDAEFLGMTKEEYVILTQESFDSLDLVRRQTDNPALTEDEYKTLIGVKPTHEYYGFTDEATMLGDNGLTQIKKEFLRRTGIDYINLVDMLLTECINPCMPKGKAKIIMESLHYSYRFLQNYAKVHGLNNMAEELVKGEHIFGLSPELKNEIKQLVEAESSPCPKTEKDEFEITDQDIICWVKCYFEKVGKMIVIESGRACIDGVIVPKKSSSHQRIKPEDKFKSELIVKDCKIYFVRTAGRKKTTTQIGSVDKNTGKISFSKTSQPISPRVLATMVFRGDKGEDGVFLVNNDELYLIIHQQKDNCDLDTSLLQHLDGTPLTVAEYDKIHRFLRLWRKLGWTIDEVDKAIVGLNANNGNPNNQSSSGNVEEDCEDCAENLCNEVFAINPALINQLVAVKQLLEQTGLDVIRLLCFWTTIGTSGKESLYERLFLKRSISSIDDVFKMDNKGNYLIGNASLLEHLPAVSAALNINGDDIQKIMAATGMADSLSLKNVSLLYRYRLLSKVLGLRIPTFVKILPLFDDIFKDANTTLVFLEQWVKMENAGFDAGQLNFIIKNVDDENKPFAPNQLKVLGLCKTLFDGLNAIDEAHKDIVADPTITDPVAIIINKQEQATSELVKNKTSLLIDTANVDKILGFLEGSIVYSTHVPQHLVISIAEGNSLKDKLKYDNQQGIIQVKGTLTDTEANDFLALSNELEWEKALARIKKQQAKLFKELLAGIFADEKTKTDDRKTVLQDIINQGDVSIAIEAIPDGQVGPNTAPLKRVAFLEIFLPYLRQQLAHRFIVDTLANYAELDNKMTDLLVSETLKLGNPPSTLYAIFEQIKDSAMPPANNWQGYLIPAADANYTFMVNDSDVAPVISIDGINITFSSPEPDDNEWWSGAIPLQAGKLYKLALTGVRLNNVHWKTPVSSIIPIPTAALIPDFATQNVEPALIALKKAAMLVNGFDLSTNEVRFFEKHNPDFDGLDFGKLEIEHWLRLEAFTRLRNSLPKTNLSLHDFWQWVNAANADSTQLSKKIEELTLWKKERVEQIISAEHFNILSLSQYRNEIGLLKLQEAIAVADRIGATIDLLFEWAVPNSDFQVCRTSADSIKNVIRMRYEQKDWEQVIKPLNDQLRNNQRDALTAFLLQQPELIAWNVEDADGLFEYFLIDVQMDACMETSRIKQANSSVQLFVQRCFLGLESKLDANGSQVGIGNNILDRSRWDWMQRYRVWEANRKVFLYPENWIESNLRDDKSPFFKELESELLQKDINKQNVIDALKAYLYKVDEVANMEVIGVYIENEIYDGKPVHKLHVFSRTRNAPYFFYYRYLDLLERNWYPWEKIQIDIPSYDVEDANGNFVGNGCYLIPVVWNGRLLIFFPQFTKKTKPSPLADVPLKYVANMSTKANKPIEYWDIKLAWSEYRNNKWTQKQLSQYTVIVIQSLKALEDKAKEINEKVNAAIVALENYETLEKAFQKAREDYETTHKQLLRDLTNSDANLAFNKAAEYYIALSYFVNGNGQEKGSRQTKIDTEFAAIKAFSEADQIKIWPLFSISNFEFVPVLSLSDPKLLGIRIFYDLRQVGVFEFSGNSINRPSKTYFANNAIEVDNFHHDVTTIKSLQISNEVQSHSFNDGGDTKYNDIDFYHPFTNHLLGIINVGNVNTFFKYGTENIASITDAFGANGDNGYHELKRPYSLYNWELFFHVPILMADALGKAQHYEAAMHWFHYIFNPVAEGAGDNRFWRFLPFKYVDGKNVLDAVFNTLKPNTPNAAITEWRNKPFMPHAVARSRSVAYMKWVVMKYINNLLAWGDHLFRQDTIETINQATQLYILAGHILGPKPMMIPKRGKVKSQTYLSLLDKWDAFGNAMVELELAAPFSNQTDLPFGSYNASTGEIAYGNIFGFAQTLYFCIPNNPKLMGYWDTVADRLYKIRHCLNIEGIFRKLPLFEPPIDPALLVKAAAHGLSIESVLNDLNTPMPNYRFYYLLQKALELCNELKSLGGALLSAIEKNDNETVALIRAQHESTMQNLMMEIKTKQLEEAEKNIESLRQNRIAPEERMKYYLKLSGLDESLVPDETTIFNGIPNEIATIDGDSGLKLIPFEKEDLDKAGEARDKQSEISKIEALAAIFHAIPYNSNDAKPWGVGTGFVLGGLNLGNVAQAKAKVEQYFSSDLTYQSSNAGKKGGFTRSLQERIFQANAAGYELKQIDKQLLAQEIRFNIANLEIKNQQQAIDNANEIEEFLKDKYTNEELYTWMRGNLKTLYKQVYNLAYDLAKKAEKTYQFERGLSNSNFIQTGYFDAGRDGLLAGEQLYVGLKQLEAAYQNDRGYDYEITKHVSLYQLDPLAVIQLREMGKCEFVIPEVIFDLDFPGHYKRRIKSISITIPCVVGPYTGINATLTLLENKFRNTVLGGRIYEESAEGDDPRFSSYKVPINAVAVSTGQNDSGVFELNFKDERYLPFEGAGVISMWRLELPKRKQFDYQSITDAIVHLKYTANEGGERFKLAADKATNKQLENIVQALNETGLHVALNIKHDMPNNWHKLKMSGVTQMQINRSRLPYMVQAITETKIEEVIFIALVKEDSSFSISVDIDSIALAKISNDMKLYRGKSDKIKLDIPFNLSIPMAQVENIEELFFVVKYK